MNIRYEYKYLISYREYLIIKDYIKFTLPNDRSGEKYSISSIYFDTANFDMYKQKSDGLFEHNKIRLRQYSDSFNPNEKIYLESKQKRELAQIKKRISFENIDAFKKYMQEPKNDYFYNLNQTTPLKPIVNVIYDREAYEDLIDNKRLRVTFDSNLRAESPELTTKLKQNPILTNPKFSPYILMEIKYSKRKLPDFINKLLKKFQLQNETFSKYAYCFEENTIGSSPFL
jgi:hypothetical protein